MLVLLNVLQHELLERNRRIFEEKKNGLGFSMRKGEIYSFSMGFSG